MLFWGERVVLSICHFEKASQKDFGFFQEDPEFGQKLLWKYSIGPELGFSQLTGTAFVVGRNLESQKKGENERKGQRTTNKRNKTQNRKKINSESSKTSEGNQRRSTHVGLVEAALAVGAIQSVALNQTAGEVSTPQFKL